jgi:hypothetical protein
MIRYPQHDPMTGEWYFKGRWYDNYDDAMRAIEAYEEHLAEQYEAEQEERKLGLA